VISLNEAFRQAWTHFLGLDHNDFRRRVAFGDIANLIETGCALREDKAFVGRSASLLTQYLINILKVLQEDQQARVWLEEMIHEPDTILALGGWCEMILPTLFRLLG